jgi:hypothetical protein
LLNIVGHYLFLNINSNKDTELQDERKEFEQFKRNLQRKMTEIEEELDTQKRELETSKSYNYKFTYRT